MANKKGSALLKKGEQPPWLKGKDFKARPENINRYGVPHDAITLRSMLLKMGNDLIEVEKIDANGNVKKVQMTRFERILFDWFNSQSFDKQQAVMQYALGKVKDEIALSTGEGGLSIKIIKASDDTSNDSD